MILNEPGQIAEKFRVGMPDQFHLEQSGAYIMRLCKNIKKITDG